MYTHVHSGSVPNRRNVEAARVSPKRWADKPTVWSSSALRRERGAGPRPAWMGSEHDTLGERRLAPQNHSLHDSLDTKCPEHWNRNAPPASTDAKQSSGCRGSAWGGEWRVMGRQLGVRRGGGCLIWRMHQMPLNCSLQMVTYLLVEFCLMNTLIISAHTNVCI